jgi:hypothetical protein
MLHIGQGLGRSNRELFAKIVSEHEGIRFILIMLLNFLCAALGVTAILQGKHSNLTHTALYLPSWIYSLALYTFLQSSYVSAKKLVTDVKERVKSERYPGILFITKTGCLTQ